MNQPIIKPSRWRQDKLIADWKGEDWTIRRHNRTSGKAGYHSVATVNSEANARGLASNANDGMSMWKYSIIAPDPQTRTPKPRGVDLQGEARMNTQQAITICVVAICLTFLIVCFLSIIERGKLPWQK